MPHFQFGQSILWQPYFANIRNQPIQNASVQNTNINAVLIKELQQLQLPAANTTGIAISHLQDFIPSVLSCTGIFRYKQNDGFEDTSQASFACWEGRDHGENTAFQLYTCFGREDFPDQRSPRVETNSVRWGHVESVSLEWGDWKYRHFRKTGGSHWLPTRAACFSVLPVPDEVVVGWV
jgi:hypothetical protein